MIKAAFIAVLAGAFVAPAFGMDPGIAAIHDHCERCHPPLADGGWEVMTAQSHTAAELPFLLRRMAEEYSAFPSASERAAIIAYLTRFFD